MFTVRRVSSSPRAASDGGEPIDRAVQAEMRVLAVAVQIERAGPERILQPALHARGVRPVLFGLGPDHVGGRRPVRPFCLARDGRGAAEVETLLATDADAVAGGAPTGLDQIEEPLGGVDDDGARRLATGVIDLLPPELLRNLADVDAGNGEAAVIAQRIVAGPRLIDLDDRRAKEILAATHRRAGAEREGGASGEKHAAGGQVGLVHG